MFETKIAKIWANSVFDNLFYHNRVYLFVDERVTFDKRKCEISSIYRITYLIKSISDQKRSFYGCYEKISYRLLALHFKQKSVNFIILAIYMFLNEELLHPL